MAIPNPTEMQMKLMIGVLLLAAPLMSTVTVQAMAVAHSRAIVVESPASLPELARNGGADMYLYDTNDGRTYLYIEANDGQHLSILNVTDPGKISAVARVAIAANSPFDFVRDLDHSGALVRYRDNSGFAVLNLKKYDRPALAQTSQLAVANAAENLGGGALLLTSASSTQTLPVQPAQALSSRADKPTNYDVIDTSKAGAPALLASVPGVKRRLSKDDTGTLFLLSDDGVTVVRRLRAEEEKAIHDIQESGN
jgi:hypothetical protein